MHIRTPFFLLLLCAVLSGCSSETEHTFLALGDSYTIGESVAPHERWPDQLTEELCSRGLSVADPKIIARTGWTTLDLKEAISGSELHPPYDLVSLLIGVNDQYQGKEISAYPDNFTYLLEKAVSLAGDRPGHVIVLSIPDYGVTPFGQLKNPEKIARELERYNTINKTISDSLGVYYVNITPGSREAASDTTLVASDGLHPSPKMYRQWVDKVLPAALSILRENSNGSNL